MPPLRLSFLRFTRLLPNAVTLRSPSTIMPELPAGWSVSNNTGNWSAPAHREVDDEDETLAQDEGLEPGDLRPDSPGWEDVEEEVDELSVKCLLCHQDLPAVRKMVEHCKLDHGFDLDEVRKANSMCFP